MGYRTYLGSLTKKEYDEVKNLTKEELFKKHDEDLEDGYVSMRDLITTTHHELGKYVDEFGDELYKPFFLNKDLQEYYTQENHFFRVEREFFEKLIEHYSELVRSYYTNMLEPFKIERGDVGSEFLNSVKSEWGSGLKKKVTFDFTKITDEEQTALFDMVEHVRSMGREWGVASFMDDMRPYELSDNPCITTSWKYEYAQFELVRIYKSFDWDNNVMVYYGY